MSTATAIFRRRIRSLFLFFLTVMVAASLKVWANSVDPTFNAVPSSALSASTTSGFQQVVQPDGKVIIFGIKGVGKADVAVFRPSTGIWYVLQSSAGITGVQWGISTDVAVPNAFLPQ